MVALTATVLLALFIQQVFSSMASGVSVGRSTSEIIQSAMVARNQLVDDVEAMTPPGDDYGFLMIVQKRYSNDPNEAGVGITGLKLRRDDVDYDESGHNSPTYCEVRSDQLVFLREQDDLEPVAPAYNDSFSAERQITPGSRVRVWYGHVRLTNENGDGAATGTDRLDFPGGPDGAPASEWVLGRQAMFLDPGSVAPPPDVYINSGAKQVDAYDGTGAPYNVWYSGLSDVIDLDMAGVAPLTAIYPDYPRDLYFLGFGAYDNVGASRPWCNTHALRGTPLEAWRMAQSHAVMLANVSEFQVDFAGDYTPVDILDIVDPQNSIYAGKPIDEDRDGNIVWYDSYDHPLPVLLPLPLPAPTYYQGPSTLQGPLFFVVHDREHAPGDDGTLPSTADAVFLWGPRSESNALLSDWPYLIRVRYRVHDKGGKLADADGQPGKVFEHILRLRDVNNALNTKQQGP